MLNILLNNRMGGPLLTDWNLNQRVIGGAGTRLGRVLRVRLVAVAGAGTDGAGPLKHRAIQAVRRSSRRQLLDQVRHGIEDLRG